MSLSASGGGLMDVREFSPNPLPIFPYRPCTELLFSFMARHVLVITPGIYFITFTCFQWVSLIHKTNTYDQVYRFFDIINQKHSMIAYVIMPNHVHFVLLYKDVSQSLNTVIGNGKRFIGYEIIKRLRTQQEFSLLKGLSMGVYEGEKKVNKQHALWKDTFDVKRCVSEKMIAQKVQYIHLNPVSGKWRLAENYHVYEHSSAGYYHNRIQGPVSVVHYGRAMEELSTL